MADVSINVPPPGGDISIDVGQTLEIHAARACNFCCTIGDHFSPSIANISLFSSSSSWQGAETISEALGESKTWK